VCTCTPLQRCCWSNGGHFRSTFEVLASFCIVLGLHPSQASLLLHLFLPLFHRGFVEEHSVVLFSLFSSGIFLLVERCLERFQSLLFFFQFTLARLEQGFFRLVRRFFRFDSVQGFFLWNGHCSRFSSIRRC